MKTTLLHKTGSDALLLFFAGWGMDETPFLSWRPRGRDFMLCYDYADLAFPAGALADYGEVRVAAWSLGVWAASLTVRDYGLRVAAMTAVNGTPYPVDDARGIPEAVFRGTLAGLDDRALGKFQRRMCGGGEALAAFLAARPRRDIASLRQELQAVLDASADVAPETKWDAAYVAGEDRIFPAINQRAAWAGTGTMLQEIAGGHWPGAWWGEIFDADGE